MEDNVTKTVLVAESSKILIKILKKTLIFEGYKVIFCEDGFEALKEILNVKPDCVVADKNLPVIDGIQLCSLIKTGYELQDIPFVLFSAEENKIDFWTNNSCADDFIYLSSENSEDLYDAVKKILEKEHVKISNFIENKVQDYKENEIALCSVKALEKIDFNTEILKRIVQLADYLGDFNTLIEKLFMLLYEISLFDAAIIIINNQPHLLYTTGLGNLEESSTASFMDICKTEYEELLNNSNTNKYEISDIEGITDFSDEEKKYASYLMFPIGENEHIGTIHMVSSKKSHFTYKIQSAVQLITKSISHIMQSSITQRRMALTDAKMRTAFSKFVPEEIIDDLISKKQETEGGSNNEKRKIAILICDIRNFTTISEVNEPENVVRFLNGYFSLMVDVIRKHGGSIDKFIGDAIMALFGAPISYIDNTRRAVDAALEMVKVLEEVDTSIINLPEGLKFDIGIGIHYGEVIVGNIGSKEKTDYTVIGDSVNLTSRIEGLTREYGTKVLISQAAKDDLNNKHPVLQLDKVCVKGKKQGVEVYRVDEKPLPEEYTTNYKKGLNLYMSGAWVLALSYFEKVLQTFPNDKAATIMKERCEDFIKNPPDEWDGAIVFTSK